MSFPIRASLHYIFPMQFSDIESILQPYLPSYSFYWLLKCHYHIFFYYQSFCFAHQWLLYCFGIANAPSAFFQPKQYVHWIYVQTNERCEWGRSFEPYGEIRIIDNPIDVNCLKKMIIDFFLFLFWGANAACSILPPPNNKYLLELTYRRMSDANEADRSSRMAR